MGCTASKLQNEDTVRQCKERRRLMKKAVISRDHLAAAHSDYLRYLRLVGYALSDFAAGEQLSVSAQTPAVFLHHSTARALHSISAATPAPVPVPPPPPTVTNASEPTYYPVTPRTTNSKVTHARSESSRQSTPRQKPTTNQSFPFFPFSSTCSSTPSQASSIWNWEDFYPPSPPDSEYFRKRNESFSTEQQDLRDFNGLKGENHENPSESEFSRYQSKEELRDPAETTEREEIHCSDWGDHDHFSSTSGEKDDDEDSKTRSNFGSSVGNPAMEKYEFREKCETESSVSWNAGDGSATEQISDLKMVVRHQDLAEIAAAIKEYFEKAADAGETVSNLLECNRQQLDNNFRQLKKTVYHSTSILSNLSSSWTSKPPLAVKYRLETSDMENSDGRKSHASTLQRLLAWEKKLYGEVKSREAVKIEHERKLSLLQSQEYKGHDDAKIDKTKVAIQRLQSLILVTSEAVTATSSAIIKIRDDEFATQLTEICHGHMHMWRSMNQFHYLQNQLVEQVRGLINQSPAGQSTTDIHRQSTQHLEATISAWHSTFTRLIRHHSDYIHSIHGWLKLSLLPVTGKGLPSSTGVSSDLYAFCDDWKQALDRLPFTVASEAIKSFINVVHAITVKQIEEHKQKKKTEILSKELEKKSASLRTIERKFYQSYSMVGVELPGTTGAENGQVLDARDPLSEKKLEIAACRRRVEDAISSHAKAIEVTRAMTLNNIQTGLPGVFQALTGFSELFAEALEGVCHRTRSLTY